MKLQAAAILCVALSGCAQQYDPTEYARLHGPEPTSADIASARARMMSCFVKNAQQLDDQRSDAATVGRSVAGVCSAESSEYARQAMWAKTEQHRAAFYSGWDKTCAEIATTAVLQHRNEKLKD